jgi:peptidoglycan/LPS O-acetylase OafA/YrhL
MASSRQIIGNLQALRAYAAANVLFVHLVQINGARVPFGLYGVDLFFVLSGFLMAMIATGNPNHFLARRLIRILPLYWLCTLAVFLVSVLKPDLLHTTRPDIINLVKSLLFIPYRKESGVVQPLLFLGWTLNYEMFFYGVFALILRLRLGHPSVWAAFLLTLLPIIGWLWTPARLPFSFYTDPIVFEFVLGVLAYHLSAQMRLQRKSALAWLGIGFCLLLLPVCEFVFGIRHRQVLLGIPAVVIVVLSVGLENSGLAVTNNLVLLAGEASYALYLTHPYVVQTGEKLLRLSSLQSSLYRVSLGILLASAAFGMAVAVHAYVELPLTEALKRLVLTRRERSVEPMTTSPAELAD